MRDQLTPKYAVGCKRPSFSNTYLKTFNRDNVLLETARSSGSPPGASWLVRAARRGVAA